MPEQPSCFHFPSMSLALGVFVDDLTLSGPQKNLSKFWSTLQKHVQLEDPAELSKVLGRNHVSCDQGLALHSADFAKSSVSNSTSSCPARRSSISAHLTAMAEPQTDDLSASSAKLVVKLMWLGRISRPDIMFAINTLARHITKWSINDDKRAARLIGYMLPLLITPMSCVSRTLQLSCGCRFVLTAISDRHPT